jgi:hypothetical protein
MNRVFKLSIAAIIIVMILDYNKSEPYIPRSFSDGEWRAVKNDASRVSAPFNTCSPENFDECAKVAFPLLSRY